VEGRPSFEVITTHPEEEYMIVFEMIPGGDAGD
jgi:hypothetical protein